MEITPPTATSRSKSRRATTAAKAKAVAKKTTTKKTTRRTGPKTEAAKKLRAKLKIDRDKTDPQPDIQGVQPVPDDKLPAPGAEKKATGSRGKFRPDPQPSGTAGNGNGVADRDVASDDGQLEEDTAPIDDPVVEAQGDADEDKWDSATDLPAPIVTYQDQANNLAKEVVKRDDYIAANPEKFADPTFFTITPGIAAHLWSRRADQQRPVARKHVEFLSRQMQQGHWQFNGDSICLNEKGDMLDGQHRCLASIDSGHSFGCIIVTVSDKSFETIDTGMRTRANGDLFRMEGESNHIMLAAALACMCEVEDGRKAYQAGIKARKSPLELKQVLQRHPDIRESVKQVGRMPSTLGRQSMYATLHYLFHDRHPEKADKFFEDLAQGAGMGPYDPVFRLRERLAQNAMSKTKANRQDIYCWFVNAWNARVRGETLQVVRGASVKGDPEIS